MSWNRVEPLLLCALALLCGYVARGYATADVPSMPRAAFWGVIGVALVFAAVLRRRGAKQG
jgi:hypothetical protein